MEELIRGYALACSSSSPLIPAMLFGGALSLIVLPLCSLPLQHGYDTFHEELASRITPSEPPNPIQDERINAVVGVIREEIAAADRDKGGSGIKPMVTGGETEPLPRFHPMGIAIVALVRNATEEFSFAPCDVYDGILDFPEVKGTTRQQGEEPHVSRPSKPLQCVHQRLFTRQFIPRIYPPPRPLEDRL